MGEERKLACTRTVAVPFKIDDQRPTGGIGGLGGNGSGGGIGLGGFGLGGVGVGVGAGLGFCGTFIASKYSTANVQNSTPDDPSTINHLLTAAICRKPGKLECSRRQIPRPFDN